jgi:hypothetical protein
MKALAHAIEYHRNLDNRSHVRLAGSMAIQDQLLAEADRAVTIERERVQAKILAADFAPGEFTIGDMREIWS